MAEPVVNSATDSNLNKLYCVRTLVASPAGPVGSQFCASEVKVAAEALGIAIHDHLVIGRKGHASFRSLGLI